MGHSLSPVSIKDVPAIVEAKPLSLSWVGKFILIVFLVVGVIGFIQGVTGDDPRRAWVAFQVNFIYWFIVSAASTCFVAVLHICNAQWSRPLQRLFEASSSYFLYSLIPLGILYFGRELLFSWSHEEIPGKGVWLNAHFVYARDIIGILIVGLIGKRLVHLSLRKDIGAIRSGLAGVEGQAKAYWEHARFNKFVAGWGDNATQEIDEAHKKMTFLSPIMVIVFALVTSLIAFDQIMSVDPHWYSTLYGIFYFMTGAYLAVSWTAIWIGMVRELHPLFIRKIERRTLHDLGKLIFGFGIFWAYMFWSHYLPIWYANMPEETAFLIQRLRERPWHDLAWIILACCFFIPFLLGLSRDIKQIPALLFSTAVLVACGAWLHFYLLFTPTLYPHHIPLAWGDGAITVGFFGAYMLSVVTFLSRVPLIPFGDFYRSRELEPVE